MDAEGKRAREMVKNLSAKEKFAHFWYYYKKHVIIAIIAIGFISWTVYEKMTQIKYDLQIPYYSSRAIDIDNNIQRFEDYFIESVADSNNNGRVDVQVLSYTADISQAKTDQMVGAMLQKMDMSLAADEFSVYILDEKYLEHFQKSYPDIKFTSVEISNIPKVREVLGLFENEKAYLVTIELFDRLKDNDAKIAEHKNALGVEKFFADKLK